jgi:hypothetical protein
MVAGVTPWLVRIDSTSLAILRLVGYGMPWVMIVDSAYLKEHYEIGFLTA